MRMLMGMLALLAACGAPQSAEQMLPDDDFGLYGAIVAVGENWQLNGDPMINAVSISIDDGTEASGTWVSPYYVHGRISASDIRVTLENAVCTHDDVPYPMRATVTFPGHTLTGCAAMRWDSQLDALIEEIDACIAAAPALRTVTYAGELPDGSVLVRVKDGDIVRDCHVERGIATLSPRNEALPMTTENTAIFVRARPGETQNPGGECYEAPEVRGLMFELLGWMLDPMGC